jgi:hypothetical protein
MKTPKDRASAILREYVHAEGELIGKAVVLADGKGGISGRNNMLGQSTGSLRRSGQSGTLFGFFRLGGSFPK